MIASVEEGTAALKLLRHLGLSDALPVLAPARVDQPELWPTGPPGEATSLRYAAALGAVLGREVDRDVMKAALGASEYVYRCLDIPPESLPWFGFDPA